MQRAAVVCGGRARGRAPLGGLHGCLGGRPTAGVGCGAAWWGRGAGSGSAPTAAAGRLRRAGEVLPTGDLNSIVHTAWILHILL